MRKLAGLAFLAFVLVGCSLPTPGAPPKLYTLTPKSSFSDSVPAVDFQLLIEPPSASAAIDTDRVVLTTSLTSLSYYSGRRWVERAPEMVQTLIVESFENSQRIVSVGRSTIGLRADYVLKTELREFQARYAGDDFNTAPVVEVAMNAKLIRMPRREIVANATFSERVVAENSDFETIVVAFDAGLGAVLKDIVTWTLTVGSNDKRSQ